MNPSWLWFSYLLHYIVTYTQSTDASMQFAGFAMVCLFVGLIGLGNLQFYLALASFLTLLVFLCGSLNWNLVLLVGRIYLGMHSLIDIIAGLAFGLAILAFWLTFHEYIDDFVVSGQNGTCNSSQYAQFQTLRQKMLKCWQRTFNGWSIVIATAEAYS